MNYVITRASPDELQHWGIKGQKWGRRRYTNEDGTRTPEGLKRYSVYDYDNDKKESVAPPEPDPAPVKEKEMSARQRRKEAKRILKEEKKEKAKSERFERLADKGLKVFELYLAYKSFKEDWM